MLNNIKETGFLEVYRYWKDHGWGIMLCYIEPPKGTNSLKWTCEYVLFRQEDSFNKTVINQDLLDLYNKDK